MHGHGGLPLGKLIHLKGPVVRVGRRLENDVVLLDDRVSRAHATFERRGSRWLIRDEGSVNGTWVGGQKLQGYLQLALGDRIKIGSNIFKFLTGSDVESAAHEEIYRLTFTDGLTNLSNRRCLQEELEKELVRARRHGRVFSLLMIDIDWFKRVNDDLGHGAGDAVLAAVASLVRSQTRDIDIVARYGGEELAVVAVEVNLLGAASLAERIRAAIEANTVHYDGHDVRVTVSIGCAEFSASDASAEELVARADAKLYYAKHTGRNRVAS